MKSQTLQYYMHDGPSAFRFELAGDLNNEGARELAQAWRTASAVIGDRALVIDLSFVTNVGEEGRSLLARWHAEGAHLIAKTRASRELAQAITGESVSKITWDGSTRRERTWRPFHAFFGAPKSMLAPLRQAEEPARMKHAGPPADAEKSSSASAVPKHKTFAFTGVR